MAVISLGVTVPVILDHLLSFRNTGIVATKYDELSALRPEDDNVDMKAENQASVQNFIAANTTLLTQFTDDIQDTLALLQGALGETDLALLQYSLACSPWLADVVEQNPVEFGQLAGEFIARLPRHDQLQALLKKQTPGAVDDADGFKQQLRQFRHLQLALVAFHDIANLSPITDVLQCQSDIADVCIGRALDVAEQTYQQRFGVPQDEHGKPLSLIVVGMGKLGGGELNFSSDVDLIYLYESHGVTHGGKKEIDNQEYFRRVGQLLIKFLDEVTADGFVYRVDMRLRPFGSSGPLVVSLDGLENYLLTQGRDWERYAWIKSRVICGSDEDQKAVADLLRPFIYRRYLDYAVFESLRDLKRQIGVKVDKAGDRKDVKLGRGGIREIEFIAQSFQLVRGGREPVLQQRSLRPVIQQLAENGHLTDSDSVELLRVYDFLRRTENRLQMADDRQTHLIPADDEARSRLALSLCFDTFQKFEDTLSAFNEFAHELFASVFSLSETAAPNEFTSIWLRIRSSSDALESDTVAVLAEHGVNDTEETARLLHEFANSGRYQRYLNSSRDLIDKLIPQSLELLLPDSNSHSEVLQRVLSLYDAIAGRVGYLQLLNDSAETLQNLIRLFAQSPWLSSFVTSHPMVLDELLDIEQGTVLMTTEQNCAALESELVYHKDADLGELMDLVRHFQHSRIVRIAAADVNGLLPVMKVSDGLSWLAESVLQVATSIVRTEMEQRHGLPQCQIDGKVLQPELSIVAYGKLGGIELGYGSDLDIVFVHESAGTDQQSDGDKPLENQVYFSRMAQKLVHFISTLTAAGTLYEIDTRLRPNGRSGVLVIGMDAFAEYQRKEAWTWEHQALVRARVVVGSQRLRDRFEQIRSNILGVAPEPETLRSDVSKMRVRMRDELAHEEAGTFDLKQGPGGIADIEFMVQYLVLKYAGENRALLEYTDNVRQLEALEKADFLNATDAKTLTDAYLYFRGRLHRRALLEDTGTISIDEESTGHREAVTDCWQKLMGGDAEAL